MSQNNPESEPITPGILDLLGEWEPKLTELADPALFERRNHQNRTIKEILGHLIDSASNNTHRIIHLQNLPSPLVFPNYASNGNNNRWIAIQHYQQEEWSTLIQTWKYLNRHLVHVISHIQPDKLDALWIASPTKNISLREMVKSYPDHLKLHLEEIQELILAV